MAPTTSRAYVYPMRSEEDDLSLLKSLIKQSCRLVCENDSPKRAKECLKGADVLVVLVCAELLGDSTIDELILLARDEGKRIVGVWASSPEADVIPPSIHKYGDALIPLDAKSVASAICGAKTSWSSKDGTPRDAPKTPRHGGK